MGKIDLRQKRLSIYYLYTVLFVITAAICFSFFIFYGKSMVWKNDGLYQHYNAFLYFGKWSRNIIKELFRGHGLVIPLWEWGFGPGNDIVGLNLIAYDPFFIFSTFFLERYAEIGYAFTIILRLWLAGLIFSIYCRKMRCCQWTTICAALMYTFCAFTIFTAPRHPNFINSMIYLSLIFLGIEKILKEESFVPFSVGVALAALSDFYFFYMIIILTVLYFFIRSLSTFEYSKPKIIGYNIFKLFSGAVIGVMAGAVILLPSILNFIQNNTRLNETYTYNFFYSSNQYSALPGALIDATGAPMSWAVIGMAPLVYIGILGSIVNRDKKQRFARIYLLMEIIFLLFPIFGRIFNGFGYVTNRWVFAWPFMPAYLFAKEFPEIIKFDNWKKGWLCFGCTMYAALCLISEGSRVEEDMVGLVFLLLSLNFSCVASFIKPLSIDSVAIKIVISKEWIIRSISVFMTMIFIYNIAFYRYSKKEKNYLNEFRDAGVINELLLNERAAAWNLIKDKGFYRIDSANLDKIQSNFSVASKQSTTTSFWSLNSADYINWRRLNNAYDNCNFRFLGLYSRAWLEPLYCAKYFVANSSKKEQAMIPYGYELQEIKRGYSDEYSLYKTNNTLPFGCTYDSVMKRSEFENLSIAERQQAALQSCIIDDNAAVSINHTTPKYNDKNIEYDLECGKNVSMEGNLLHVKSRNSTIEITFNSKPIGELYVLFSGLDYQNGATSTEIIADCNGASMSVAHYTKRHIYAEGRTEYLINLGYSEEDRNKITITFSQKGDYSFDMLKVICQPMEKLPEYIKARSEDQLENVQFSTNRVSGTIDLNTPKFLCMSLPYSKGWTAYVDGQKVDLLNANIAFSGLELDAGHHEIELKFCTPYIKIGAVLSVLGFILIIVEGVLFKNQERFLRKIKRYH